MKKILFSLASFLGLAASLFAQKYVATDGDDANPGTIAQPFKTITRAVSVAVPGDTIYVRGGSYVLNNTINISAGKSGTETQRYYLFAYKNERPLLDFSSSPVGRKGFNLNASFWHFKGLEVKGAGDNGLEISGGTNNIIEYCAFFENRDSGVQLNRGAAHNRIINCDSYYNADPPDNGDADGFAPKLSVGTGNYFFGCRAWGNVDDGWDGFLEGANDMTTTLENCWTWGNGYLKDGTDPGPQANGNGFKMGGADNSNSLRLMHHFMLKNCLAFGNKQKGFDQNHNAGSMLLFNCTGFNNKLANYRITEALNPGQALTVKNSVSLVGAVELGFFAIQEVNGWMNPFVVTAADFLSLDPASAAAPRQAGGSLPEIDFMHLASGSDLIDAGVDLGIPFNGTAPDLGTFESNLVAAIETEESIPAEFRLYQNSPNPFNPETAIQFKLPRPSFVTLRVYDLSGQEVATLIDDFKSMGEHRVTWRPRSLSSGIYFYRLQAGRYSETKKLILQE
ncbi:MAG: right-handed parallel beta-helix repeat-containing protein [bacterium]